MYSRSLQRTCGGATHNVVQSVLVIENCWHVPTATFRGRGKCSWAEACSGRGQRHADAHSTAVILLPGHCCSFLCLPCIRCLDYSLWAVCLFLPYAFMFSCCAPFHAMAGFLHQTPPQRQPFSCPGLQWSYFAPKMLMHRGGHSGHSGRSEDSVRSGDSGHGGAQQVWWGTAGIGAQWAQKA